MKAVGLLGVTEFCHILWVHGPIWIHSVWHAIHDKTLAKILSKLVSWHEWRGFCKWYLSCNITRTSFHVYIVAKGQKHALKLKFAALSLLFKLGTQGNQPNRFNSTLKNISAPVTTYLLIYKN